MSTHRRLITLALAVLVGVGAAAASFALDGPELQPGSASGTLPSSNPSGAQPVQGKYPQSFPSAQVSETVREWSKHGTVANRQEGALRSHELKYTDPADGRLVHRVLQASTDGTGRARQLYCTVSSVDGYNAQALQKLDECIKSVLRGAEAASVLGWLHAHVASKPAGYTRKDFPAITAGTSVAKHEVLVVLMPRLPNPPASEQPVPDPYLQY